MRKIPVKTVKIGEKEGSGGNVDVDVFFSSWPLGRYRHRLRRRESMYTISTTMGWSRNLLDSVQCQMNSPANAMVARLRGSLNERRFSCLSSEEKPLERFGTGTNIDIAGALSWNSSITNGARDITCEILTDSHANYTLWWCFRSMLAERGNFEL